MKPMNNKAFEVGMDIMKAQPCPVCGGIGAEVSAGCPKQAPAIMCPIRRKETRRSRNSELSRIGGQNDNAPMSLEDMRNEFIINNSDDKDWYEDASRDKELDSKPNDTDRPYTDMVNRFKDAQPPLARHTKQVKGLHEKWGAKPDPHKKPSSSLIDRARKANKEDPRPGSANYSKKGNE
tara:strand:- start:1215 stop:1751 length:537 start_codon:yes stop_codon:yes gene_type:complete